MVAGVELEAVASADHLDCLLASADAEFVARMEAGLAAQAARVHTVATAEALLKAAAALPHALVALDTRLPGLEMGQLLASMRGLPSRSVSRLVLFSDTVTEEWRERLREGMVSDVAPLSIPAEFLAVRLAIVLAAQKRECELEQLRERDALCAAADPQAGIYNRSSMLTLLFRETDRMQRMKTALCLILLDIDDFGHWKLHLGTEACDDLLAQTAARLRRLLRSYDLVGRMGDDEFLVALPGCSAVNGRMLAERIKRDVFATPYQAASKSIRLSACFAVTSSQGRSPVVVLRELEEELRVAKRMGPETIRMAAEWRTQAATVEFLSPTSRDSLGW